MHTYQKIIIIILIAISISFIPKVFIVSDTVSAEIYMDEYDMVFRQTLGVLAEEMSDDGFIETQKTVIYDKELRCLGYIYDFTIMEQKGFAIIINIDGEIVATEFVPEAQNPYSDCEGEKIYLEQFNYFDYYAGSYRNLISGEIYSREDIENIYESTYCGVEGSLVNSTSMIYYENRSGNNYQMATAPPAYYDRNGLANVCAPVAGANIIAYYDRYKGNLIEDYTPGTALGSLYRYKSQNEVIDSLVAELYSDMGTNSSGAGNTVAEFKDGLEEYCGNRGYTITFNNCMNNGQLNYNSAKIAMESGSPLVLFVRELAISDINEGNGCDTYYTYSGSANHTMVGFGYADIIYELSDGSEKICNFIMVATGLHNLPFAYLNLNENIILDESYSVSVD